MTARSPEARERARARSRAYYAAHRDYFRSYHSDPERRARWNAERRTPEYRERAKAWPSYGIWRRRRADPPRPPQLDLDDLTEQAMAIAGIDSVPDPAYDAGWRDLVQEAVLALLEGRDPEAAVRAERSRIRAAQLHVRDERVMLDVAA